MKFPLPRRGATRMTYFPNPISISYWSGINSMTTIIDDGMNDTRSAIQKVWYLFTRDMPITKMPVIVHHSSGVYHMWADQGRWSLSQGNLDMTCNYYQTMPRPYTPYHIDYMLDNLCSWEDAVKGLEIDREVIKQWTKQRTWAN